jgi:hypothetical protein
MRHLFWLLVLVAMVVMGCATLDTGQLELHRAEIRSVAILPLVLGDANTKVGGGPAAEKEIGGLMAYWQANFNALFKARMSLVDGIQVKYAGEDFVKAIPANVDYGQLMDELGVDAVLSFNLLSYNETKPLGSMLLSIVGVKENPTARFNLHFYYLHLEDWSPYLAYDYEIPAMIGEMQRGWVVDRVIEWLNLNWPLSVNFQKKK